jgi:hypothetical protein
VGILFLFLTHTGAGIAFVVEGSVVAIEIKDMGYEVRRSGALVGDTVTVGGTGKTFNLPAFAASLHNAAGVQALAESDTVAPPSCGVSIYGATTTQDSTITDLVTV